MKKKEEDFIDSETGDFKNLAAALDYYGETWHQNLGPGYPDPEAYGPAEQDLFVRHCTEVNQKQMMQESFTNALHQVFPPQSPVPDLDFVASVGAETVEERKRGEGNLNTRSEVKRLRAEAERTSDPRRKKELLEMATNFEHGYQEDRQKKPYGFEIKFVETQFSNAKKELEGLVNDPQQKAKIKENSLYFQSLVRAVNRELKDEEYSFFMGKDPKDENFVIARIPHGEKASEFNKQAGAEEWLAKNFKYQFPDPPPAGMERKAEAISNPNDEWGKYENPQMAFEQQREGKPITVGLRPQPKPEVSQPAWEASLRPVE